MSQLLELKNIKKESKELILNELGYKTDGKYIFDKKGKKVIDRYIEQPVLFNNMLILPGSTIIIDNNPLSIALYMEEHKDVF